MSYVWECSRNDIASNLSVFIAATAVRFFASVWPDIPVASCLAVLLLRPSFNVINAAFKELKSFSTASNNVRPGNGKVD